MKRNPDGGEVSCDGSDQNSDHHQNSKLNFMLSCFMYL